VRARLFAMTPKGRAFHPQQDDKIRGGHIRDLTRECSPSLHPCFGKSLSEFADEAGITMGTGCPFGCAYGWYCDPDRSLIAAKPPMFGRKYY